MSDFQPDEFWVVNISDRNVTLSDLRISIPHHSSLNLLDSRHYSYTYQQLKQSALEGSIFKKRDKIKVGKQPAEKPDPIKHTLSNRPMVRRKRSAVKVEKMEFEEFAMSDEEYAAEMARDWAELDPGQE